MRKVLIAAAIVLLTTASAVAMDDLKRMQVASSLGDLLASEQPCGLSFNKAAIDKFIDQNVPADDMEFTSMLATMTTGHEFKSARCRPQHSPRTAGRSSAWPGTTTSSASEAPARGDNSHGRRKPGLDARQAAGHPKTRERRTGASGLPCGSPGAVT